MAKSRILIFKKYFPTTLSSGGSFLSHENSLLMGEDGGVWNVPKISYHAGLNVTHSWKAQEQSRLQTAMNEKGIPKY